MNALTVCLKRLFLYRNSLYIFDRQDFMDTQYFTVIFLNATICPRSRDPFYICKLLYKMGHYFLDIQYIIKKSNFLAKNKVVKTAPQWWAQIRATKLTM